MSTIYDWVTIGIFAGLIVLFLQRSTDEGPEVDSIWHYLPPQHWLRGGELFRQ